ncbi:hypothetical protein GE21DRAFT_6938 [Neurospora crassa]|uniref:Uncharacterized protein n=1 Tax=Neurospora crassa (strain ATCC 24698 / 74-OR23-1A / CBS 708.71 / DSM 1257 / FGSC 987) TaxID=367110 RepID=Q7S1Q6_NEUCR|nr:hypothetical protein NCU09836 [Neurospora crassa OR74A]EAA29299.1 hypothetical protein NCU09836 [Neurospora crassa OR74A]KHE84981.1 hypothetical protein GE21DRAFT_6938 [Neurospora crassa]|eukprot:XP_958535.1 hypothetical protein NCU09836 [Neurospora crassa OR74A]
MPVQPIPPPTSSNSSRFRRSSDSLAISNRLTDSQILYPGSTEDDDESDKDNKNNEDDEIYDSISGKETQDAADDECLARLKGDSSTASTMETFSKTPGENENKKHKTFDRWFITRPVPKNRPKPFPSAPFPAQTFQATNPSTPFPSHGTVSATFNAHGGLFESAFQGGFSERADAIISIEGPGMGGDRQWPIEATFELAKVTNSDNIAHLDAHPEERQHTGMMDNIRWRNANLFLARKKGDPDYDLDPREFNRQFGKQAREAEQAEEEAAKQAEEEAARKRAEALLAFEKLYVLPRENLQPSRFAKELSTTHSRPARTNSYFFDTFASSKKPKESTTERPVQSAKTWPVRNSFTAWKKVEDFNSRAKESHMDAESETFGSMVRKLTFGSRNL